MVSPLPFVSSLSRYRYLRASQPFPKTQTSHTFSWLGMTPITILTLTGRVTCLRMSLWIVDLMIGIRIFFCPIVDSDSSIGHWTFSSVTARPSACE
jgi:hypothetical protein